MCFFELLLLPPLLSSNNIKSSNMHWYYPLCWRSCVPQWYPTFNVFFEVREMEDVFLNLSVTCTIFSRNQHERKYLLTSDFPSTKPTCSGKTAWETHFQKVLFGDKMVVICPWLFLDVLRWKERKCQVFILMIQRWCWGSKGPWKIMFPPDRNTYDSYGVATIS